MADDASDGSTGHEHGMGKARTREPAGRAEAQQEAAYGPTMSNDELVVVHTFQNRIEAEIAQGALEVAEIESIISADDAGGLWADFVRWGGVRLLVRAEDAEQASKILGQPNGPPPVRERGMPSRRTWLSLLLWLALVLLGVLAWNRLDPHGMLFRK